MSQAEEEEPTLPPEQEAALLAALEAALRPGSLDPARNEQLLELALDDPLAPPSAEELVESARLRDALAAGAPHEVRELLGALRAPFTEPLAGELGVERAVRGALQAPAAKRGNVVYAVFGAVCAAAAAFALVASQAGQSAPASSADASAYVLPRSTASLFAERFETGDTSARMDLIASARSRDLRDNRYAAWGVR